MHNAGIFDWIAVIFAAFSVLPYAIVSILAFSKEGKAVLIGKEGSVRRQQYHEQKMLRYFAWGGLACVSFIASLLILRLTAGVNLIPAATSFPMLFFLFANSKRFKKSPSPATDKPLVTQNEEYAKTPKWAIFLICLMAFAFPLSILFAAFLV